MKKTVSFILAAVLIMTSVCSVVPAVAQTVEVIAKECVSSMFFGFDGEELPSGFSVTNVKSHSISNGFFTAEIATGSNTQPDTADPYLTYDAEFQADDYSEVRVRIRYDTQKRVSDDKGNLTQLFYTGVDKSGNKISLKEDNSVKYEIDSTSNGEYVVFTYKLDNISTLKGATIKSLRFDLVNTVGSICVDYIWLVAANPDKENKTNEWDFADSENSEGWSFTAINNTVQTDGTVKYTSPGSWTPNLIANTVNVEFSGNNFAGIEILMKYDFADGVADSKKTTQVFYSGTDVTGTLFQKSETFSKILALNDNSGDGYELIFFDLSESPKWSGSFINDIMIKPLNSDGDWEIDYIRVVPYEGNYNTPLNTELLSLSYLFENADSGTADGVISLDFGGQLSSNAKAVSLMWASGNKSNGYASLADYTEIYNLSGSKLENGYKIDKNMLIPDGATALIAEITDCEKTFKITYTLPQNKLAPERGTPLYTAAFISDIHIGNNGAETAPSADRHIPTQQQIDELADFVVVNGDLVQWYGAYSQQEFLAYNYDGTTYKDNGETSPQYLGKGTDMWAILRGYFESFSVPVYAVQGNHDVRDGDNWSSVYYTGKYWNDFLDNWVADSCSATDGQKYQKEVTLKSGANYYDTEINGHHYIFLEIPRDTAPYYSFGEEQLAWLDKKLFEKEATGKPIFVFGHVPAETQLSGGFHDTQLLDNDAFMAILQKHPTAIYTSGHTHYTLDTNLLSSIDGAQETPSFINDGGITDINYHANDVVTGKQLSKNTAHGVIAEIYEDCIVLKGRNFTDKKWIPRGLTGLTLKANNPVSGFSVTKMTAADGITLSIDDDKNKNVTYEWYLDGVLQQTAATALKVPKNYGGYVAVRAKDGNGNYVSQLYDSLGDIKESTTHLLFNGEKITVCGLETSAKLVLAAFTDGMISSTRIIPLTKDADVYISQTGIVTEGADEIRIILIETKTLKPLCPNISK